MEWKLVEGYYKERGCVLWDVGGMSNQCGLKRWADVRVVWRARSGSGSGMENNKRMHGSSYIPSLPVPGDMSIAYHTKTKKCNLS